MCFFAAWYRAVRLLGVSSFLQTAGVGQQGAPSNVTPGCLIQNRPAGHSTPRCVFKSTLKCIDHETALYMPSLSQENLPHSKKGAAYMVYTCLYLNYF